MGTAGRPINHMVIPGTVLCEHSLHWRVEERTEAQATLQPFLQHSIRGVAYQQVKKIKKKLM